jgi:hypothetical protein
MYACINKYLLDCLPALTHSSLGFEPLGVVIRRCPYNVCIIAVAEIISTRLSLAASLISTFSSPATIVGGTAISTLATALAPTARIISNLEP